MKQYTTPDQTAKLIELGLADSTREERYKRGSLPKSYSIGELIEMLIPKPHCRVSVYNVGLKQHKVLFKKLINGKFKALFSEVGYEPIDLLFNCIVKLK